MCESISKEALRQFIETHPIRPFKPIAYYNGGMDEIVVLFEDASFTEVEFNENIGLLKANHMGEQAKYIGFIIYGAKRLMQTSCAH